MTYLHTNFYTYILTHILTYKLTNILTNILTYITSYILRYLHAYILTYVHTYILAYVFTHIRIRIRILPISADDSELVPKDYLCAKQLSTPHQLARLMEEATADRDLVLHHTDTVAFSVATKPDDHSYPPSLRQVPIHSWVD